MSYIYVCDHCGTIVTITVAAISEGEHWECDKCSSSALWEFTNAAHARAHAEHIARVHRTGLFRRAS